MADPTDARETLGKIAKLLILQRELLDKVGAVGEEMDELLGGRAGIGADLKAFEAGFDAAWCARYAPGQSKQYLWAYTKDRPTMKRVIKRLGLDEALARAARYLASDDPFYARTRHAFAVFVASINSHAAPAVAPEPVAGCGHEPACRSDAEHTRRKLAESRQC